MSALENYLRNHLNKVQPSGDHFVLAACPVHKGGKERHPSFSVNLRSGRYHCFSCKIKGTFEDLKLLLGNPTVQIQLNAADDEPEYHSTISEATLAMFHHCPVSLLEAGFTEATLLEHGVGHDPLYDRITFPIRDTDGNLVAVSGRAPEGIEPRYKVYSQSMLRGGADLPPPDSHKVYKARNKNWLWMAHTIEKPAPRVFVVEGYKACMWMRQCGVKNTVATMGTMVTKNQLSELQRLCDRAIIVFDMDESGREASKKVQKQLLERGVPTHVLTYDSKQPDGLSLDQIKQLTHPYTHSI